MDEVADFGFKEGVFFIDEKNRNMSVDRKTSWEPEDYGWINIKPEDNYPLWEKQGYKYRYLLRKYPYDKWLVNKDKGDKAQIRYLVSFYGTIKKFEVIFARELFKRFD